MYVISYKINDHSPKRTDSATESLSNSIFTSHDDIVDHCCFAWTKRVDQRWKIMSIGLRQ